MAPRADRALELRKRLGNVGLGLSFVRRWSDALEALATEPYELLLLDLGAEGASHRNTSLSSPSALGRAHPFRLGTSVVDGDEGAETLRAVPEDPEAELEWAREGWPACAPGVLRFPAREPTVPSIGNDLLIGSSALMTEVRQQLRRYAATNAPLLLRGETGTGKELAARTLHRVGPRARGPFVPLNCAAVPGELFESELFGVARGAYTGAASERSGLLAEAEGGILFLDEVGDLPLALQAKLLRFLDDGSYRRVGSVEELHADVRVVAATNRDLGRQVEARTFRADLYYRLAALEVVLPPLRDHPEDIPELVEHFMGQILREVPKRALATDEASCQLRAASWPGNVRQLRSVVERTLLDTAERGLCFPLRGFSLSCGRPGPPGHRDRRAEAERLAALLREHGGHLPSVATALGVSVRTVQRRLRSFGLRRRDLLPSSR